MKSLLIASLSLTLAGAALAGPTCTASRDGWKEQETFKKELQTQGYQIRKFKVTDGNCYEIYGLDKAGRKVEIYFHPVSGEVVEAETR